MCIYCGKKGKFAEKEKERAMLLLPQFSMIVPSCEWGTRKDGKRRILSLTLSAIIPGNENYKHVICMHIVEESFFKGHYINYIPSAIKDPRKVDSDGNQFR